MTQTSPPEPEHSELPPSSSDKWLTCHGWLRMNQSLGHDGSPPSEASTEGSYAHLAFEWALLDGGTEILEHVCTLPMEEDLIPVLEWAWNLEGTVHPEQRVDYGQVFEYVGLTGTSDLIEDHPDYLHVADLKYGRGLVELRVPGGFNPQLMIYLVGAVAKFGPRKSYRLSILQPRAYHKDGPIRTVEVPPEELDAFSKQLEHALAQNYTRGKLVTGDHCRKWCRALAVCPAVKEQAITIFRNTPI